MFTYQEALDEQKRMVDFRDKHYYNAELWEEEQNDSWLDQQPTNIYKF